jgi:integrase
MANKIVVVYQHVKINNKWTFKKVPAMRRRFLSNGAYYISWYEGNRKQMEHVGPDPAQAEKALEKKSAELSFLAVGGEIKANPADTHVRVKVSEAVDEYLSDCRDRQGKSGYGLAARTVEAYQYRLGYLTSFRTEAYLDGIDAAFIKQLRRFLIAHPDNLGDRTCYNVMQAVSTFLNRHNIGAAKPFLKEMSFPPKPVIPYTHEMMEKFFAACNEEEGLTFKFFLHSMGRDLEVAFVEVRDLLFANNVLHISSKPDKGFRLKGKRSGQAIIGRKVPIPAAFMASLKRCCEGKGPRDLVFPNGKGGIQYHFLRMCKNIAKRAGLSDWREFNLHRWRKTGATCHHESGVSVRKIQAWLGHESLDVTLDYLGVSDAADDYSQDQVNKGALAGFV